MGLVVSSTIFHPKVVVLAGTKRVQIAVGSGNLTLGGWQYNDEVWLRFNANADSHPTVLLEISHWLRELSDSTWLDAESRMAAARSYRLIQRLIDQGQSIDTGHRFVTSAHSSIIEELPHHPPSYATPNPRRRNTGPNPVSWRQKLHDPR